MLFIDLVDSEEESDHKSDRKPCPHGNNRLELKMS